ncbi:redoxin domain-containing protein [Aliiglaciecola litoralis]|uniref:Peroxiredoxin-like family protein n=1 Tax=Aliiglaciecola litoralis TaxID=582857 RepID=A0ABP3WPK4_9ALTE
MLATKPEAGSQFPPILVKTLDNRETLLVDVNSDPANSNKNADWWKVVVVYRGQHCPICTNFLNALDSMYGRFQGIKVDIVAVSADSAVQLQENIDNDLQVSFPLFHSLQEADMKTLGLYISDPRSEAETDHAFAEPGLFVLNEKNQMQLIDIASGPFSRPNIDQLYEGLAYARENDYPIRGTHTN